MRAAVALLFGGLEGALEEAGAFSLVPTRHNIELGHSEEVAMLLPVDGEMFQISGSVRIEKVEVITEEELAEELEAEDDSAGA